MTKDAGAASSASTELNTQLRKDIEAKYAKKRLFLETNLRRAQFEETIHLKQEKYNLKEQEEAATIAILMRKNDEYDLLKFIREVDEKREARLKNMNEERQAFMTDLTDCLN